jgi:sugar-specific transcriptional regulator TrmB
MQDSSDESSNTLLVRRAGLSVSQAKCYLAFIEHGVLSPTEVAARTGESRTNSYMICEKLEQLGLLIRKEGKKLAYFPAHPSALETLAEKRRKIMMRNEQAVKQNLSPLIDLFYASTEMPGTRTLQGIDGIKEVYQDTLRVKQDLYLLRSIHDTPVMGINFFNEYKAKRAANGIHTFALTPDSLEVVHNQRFDEKLLITRTILPKGYYTGAVEIDVYGSKVALISFGDTQMATIIDSPPIAEAMRQILQLLIQQFSVFLGGQSSGE